MEAKTNSEPPIHIYQKARSQNPVDS